MQMAVRGSRLRHPSYTVDPITIRFYCSVTVAGTHSLKRTYVIRT